MNNWIKILTFIYPHEAHLAKGKLEAEGIEVQIKDELTAQVNNFYSNAIGGVKLLVHESDYEKAYCIVVAAGYINETKNDSKFLNWFDQISSKLPLIGKTIIELRIIIISTLILILISIPITILILPSTYEKLTENKWCLDNLYYKGEEYFINPEYVQIIIENANCSETFQFKKNGDIILPGFNTYNDKLRWKLVNDSIVLSKQENNRIALSRNSHIVKEDSSFMERSVYEGIYYFEIKNDRIFLKSDSITIYGKVYRFSLGL